jgi:hypothetical protein
MPVLLHDLGPIGKHNSILARPRTCAGNLLGSRLWAEQAVPVPGMPFACEQFSRLQPGPVTDTDKC